MAFYTPLRYPGGKGKLAPFIQEVFKFNNLSGGTYIEPYAGGAAVAISLLLNGYVENIILNDIDRKIYALWWSILNKTDDLCKIIHETPVNIKNWKIQRVICQNQDDYNLLEAGFSTFFMNRTNRSGILFGGVIGGNKQDGKYKIDARYNKKNLIQRIETIAKHKKKIKIYNEDALFFIKRLMPKINSKTLIYFDPPYYKKGKLLYHNFFKERDHIELSKFIRSIETPWIVTYDNTQEITKQYAGEHFAEFDISYYAHLTRPKGREVLFYKNINLPSLPYTSKESHRKLLKEQTQP